MPDDYGARAEFLNGASVDRLTELWVQERARDTALALIDAKIKAECGAAEG